MNPQKTNPNTRYLGIDLGGTSVKFGRVTDKGVIERQSKAPTASEGGREALLNQLSDIGATLIAEARKSNYKIPYLGIVTPGTVDSKTGTILSASPNLPDWIGAEISKILKSKLGIPILVENDARGMASAEFNYGAGIAATSAICITVGTGIGGALIINNQLWRGHSQSAGEIGHSIVDVDDSLTSSGLPGTLENLTSANAIERRIKEKIATKGCSEIITKLLNGDPPETLSARQIFEAYHKGDSLAIVTLRETGEILGKALAGFVNLINPEIVIIGGGVTEAVPELVDWVRQKIEATALASATSDLKVVQAKLGNSAGLIGAALLGKQTHSNELLNSK